MATLELSAGFPRLLADIGGTNARFGWQAGPGQPVRHVTPLVAADHADVVSAARHYLKQLEGEPAPRAAAFAVATAVIDDKVVFTNSRWSFSCAQAQEALCLDRLLVLNDFEALALSLPGLVPGQLRVAAGPQPGPMAVGSTLAVVGPGTGLGVGAATHTRLGWLALPGEGGHATLAAADDLESAVLAALRRRFDHVSAERVLSGMGLPSLHRALLEVHAEPIEEPQAPALIQAALGGDASATRTLDMFCAMLGTFAGNVALTFGARGGLYIGGGMVPRFADLFVASRFRERFEAKGRFAAYLRHIPTPLVTDTLTALSGAALALDQAALAPSDHSARRT